MRGSLGTSRRVVGVGCGVTNVLARNDGVPSSPAIQQGLSGVTKRVVQSHVLKPTVMTVEACAQDAHLRTI